MTFLARSVVDPRFLAAVRTRRPQGVDVERLSAFAGFVTKVQSNFLWESLPGTLAALRHARIENRVFQDFSPAHWRLRRRRAPFGERIDVFIAALTRWLTRRKLYAIRDLLTHEAAQRSTLARAFVVVRLGSDPEATFARVQEGLELDGYERRPHRRVYSARDGAIRAFEIDRDTARVLELIDGKRSARSVVAGAARRGISSQRTREVLKALSEMQLWPKPVRAA
jgi:hypothetical protein